MSPRTVQLRVAGQTCRVATTADDGELERLTAMVEEKLGAIVAPGRPVTTQAVLLAAIALAHDADEQRTRAEALTSRARETLGRLLTRVDAALAAVDGHAAVVAPAGGDGHGGGARAVRTTTAGAVVVPARRTGRGPGSEHSGGFDTSHE